MCVHMYLYTYIHVINSHALHALAASRKVTIPWGMWKILREGYGANSFWLSLKVIVPSLLIICAASRYWHEAVEVLLN